MSYNQHGFILSDIFSRYFEISSLDPSSLIGTKDTLPSVSEISLKISKIFPGSEGIKNLSDLKKFLLRNLRDEALEFVPFSNVFLDYHRIQCFFIVYDNKDEDVISYHIGYFNQLKCISFCKDFRDIKNFILKDSSIEEYFDGIEEEGNVDVIYNKVMRNFYMKNLFYMENHFYGKNLYLQEEIKIFLGNSSDHSEICGISLTEDEISKIRRLSPDDLHKKLMRIYKEAFDSFGDIAVVYSYLRFRELQIREILYHSEQVLNKN